MDLFILILGSLAVFCGGCMVGARIKEGRQASLKSMNYGLAWALVKKQRERCQDCHRYNKLYQQYKSDWCEARGYNLCDIDEEVGINGECYACFEEWYQNEYMGSRGE